MVQQGVFWILEKLIYKFTQRFTLPEIAKYCVLLNCDTSIHTAYIILLEVVFTGHTVPVVQVLYQQLEGNFPSTVVLQYPLQ